MPTESNSETLLVYVLIIKEIVELDTADTNDLESNR